MSQPPHLPPQRQGPRPLALHLGLALTPLLTSGFGLPLLTLESALWKPALRPRLRQLLRDLTTAGICPESEKLRGAVDREARRQMDAVLTGLTRYRHHPYCRNLPDPPVLWQEGSARLLAYGAPEGRGAAVFFVPSLVNRAYVLDLAPGRSLMRWLAAQGVRPFLLDWGTPQAAERRFSLTDVIAGRLERALAQVVRAVGRPVPVVGYCMGGLLALALAQRRPEQVAGLGLLATPWDFHAQDAALAIQAAGLLAPYGMVIENWGELPLDILQALFAALDPRLALKKFSQFAAMNPASAAAQAFVALEDWLNDGVPLPALVARDCIAGWYGRNDTACGRWLIAGEAITPQRIAVPTLALIPARDRIVPPASALALARQIPQAQILTPPLGHIGMVVSGGAEKHVWNPLRQWLEVVGLEAGANGN